jgi:hypothetical protein
MGMGNQIGIRLWILCGCAGGIHHKRAKFALGRPEFQPNVRLESPAGVFLPVNQYAHINKSLQKCTSGRRWVGCILGFSGDGDEGDFLTAFRNRIVGFC